MKYITLDGDFLVAYDHCVRHGGQLFPGNKKDSASVVLCGSNCFLFWPPGSKTRQLVIELCSILNVPSDNMTGGRLARYFVENILKPPYEKTFWSKTYRSLAKQGTHWHYLHCQTHKIFWGIEVDIKSAYFSSLFSFPSLLFQPEIGYLNDAGAMDSLKELNKHLPKWFRLQLLGCLASWRVFYYCKDKSGSNHETLIKKVRFNINYGAMFNVAHRAILRNYKIMQKIHQIGGEYIRRIHTDSFFIDIDIPGERELQIFDYIKSKNLEFTVKGFGTSWFVDVNTGFIGNKLVGAKVEVSDAMRQNNVKMKSKKTNEQILHNDSLFISNAQNYDSLLNLPSGDKCNTEESRQLGLFENNFAGD